VNLGLAGRSIIVTGGSRGIGAAAAEALASEGANLALIARGGAALANRASELQQRWGVRVHPVRADLEHAEEPERAVRTAIELLGGVDVLVNNAGTSPFGSFDAIGDAQWTAGFQLKVMGYVRCIRAVLPTMRDARSGRIVNVVGMAGRFATPGYVLGAFNAALLHLTKSLAHHVAADGVTVVAINPAVTSTARMMEAMQTWASEAGEDVESYTRRYLDGLPARRFVKPEEIGRLIAILASDQTHVVNGSALQADAAAPAGVF
jgi:NAD(P)-dependent dehydrogenase (short-subunit alcohol dehydrogenase family)